MAGVNRQTGKPLDGFADVLQSLVVIITTTKATRVMRRDFGSPLRRLVDRPISPLTLIDWYAAIAEACLPEPRFRLTRATLATDSDVPSGAPIFDIVGLYYPRGHLGDFSIVEDASGRLVLA